MEKLRVGRFNLCATIESGQLFRYRKLGDWYQVAHGAVLLNVRQSGQVVEYECSDPSFNLKNFLGLAQNHASFRKLVSRDEGMAALAVRHAGLRIIRQEPWECVASFILSSFSNIPRIRRCVESVAASFGRPVNFRGRVSRAFPRPFEISNFSKLQRCGLGYRDAYLFGAAKLFEANECQFSFDAVRKLPYEDAKELLRGLPGVGEKVADCVLLFAYGFMEAFPTDVWIARAMMQRYAKAVDAFSKKKGRKISPALIAEFGRAYFGRAAGYAQQLLYYDSRRQVTPNFLKKNRFAISAVVK